MTFELRVPKTHNETALKRHLPDKKKMVVSAKNCSVFQKSMREGRTDEDTLGLP